jgi:phosphatidylglycerol:prolipoprotein diacylglycerol transferase
MISYILWDADPEIFTIPEFGGFGPFPVRWYGLLFAAGFLIGQQVMIHVFKKERKPLEDIDALTLYMVISTVLGARIGHFLFYQPEILFKNPLEVILPPYAGLASHGAVIGIVVALAGSFIRFGNLMNSEIVGTPTDLPWGFIFMKNTEFLQIPRHPSQLYESISCMVLFFILLAIWNRYKENTPRGMLVGVFFVWVFTLRFLYEFIKENQEAFEANYALNMGQILSIPVVMLGLYFIWQSRRNAAQRIA